MVDIVLPADSTTLTLNGDIINDTVAGDKFIMTPVNPVTAQVPGSNGSVSIQGRTDRGVYDVTIRVLKYSESDALLSGWVAQSTPMLIEGSAKTSFIRNGTNYVDSWTFAGGSITTQPTNTVNDQDGNALSEYMIRFNRTVRIQ